MSKKFREYKEFNLSQINKDILKFWEEDDTFHKSITTRAEGKPFIFYEGPPSANGQPGIHHVVSRAIKDIFCRYKTQQGFLVKRKAGWDTHGLAVGLSVEKALGITKEDIGKHISVADYNAACRREVMKYTDLWEDLTQKMGYWVNMDDPYITYDNRYIETLWWLLKSFYNKNLLYKGYSIQPYSPAAGTGLSSHELNQPGCYRDVKDTTCIAQFNVIRDAQSTALFDQVSTDLYILAWTTTPWTLPSNTALAVGPSIKYVKVQTFNPYTAQPITVVLAKNLFRHHFPEKNEALTLDSYNGEGKNIPYLLLGEFSGSQLVGVNYDQLFPWVKPMGDAFRVIPGDFVTTEDGTGIVHIAPTFGADDDRVAKQTGIAPLLMMDNEGKRQPMVDRQGRFFRLKDLDPGFIKTNVNRELYGVFAGRFVKNSYDNKLGENDATLDVDLSVQLKKEGKAFRVEKYEHSYPHCWRTDKPVLYYPLDSWFIRSTAVRDEMIDLNRTINWKPASTGTGRFGNWLENLVDWNLSRSRYWGTPLPIWRTEDGDEEKCIGSIDELKTEIKKSVEAGLLTLEPGQDINAGIDFLVSDLHKPFVDNIILVSSKGQPMKRVPDLIDVWFDSGAMPYAQWHFPFENKEEFAKNFPADFIAEGVDQTRGWFYTLHALAVLLFDSVAYKTVVSNGLVLDKNGNKMSKRVGNVIDPFETLEIFGPDATRWYLITNASPWDSLKFDIEGIKEVQRKFFGTLYNTYQFFALYANVDAFSFEEKTIPVKDRPEIDQWIISSLNTLIQNVTQSLDDYEPTQAGRYIEDFVDAHLSNWYVRLCRRRFWKPVKSKTDGNANEIEDEKDKISAYQTLYECLQVISGLIAPIAPFFSDWLFKNLNSVTKKLAVDSIHLSDFPQSDESVINTALEERMQLAQDISSLILSLRKKVNIKVRQPLQKVIVPAIDSAFEQKIKLIENIIKSETNIKEVDIIPANNNFIKKKAKANFKTLGKKLGSKMKWAAEKIQNLEDIDINKIQGSDFLLNPDFIEKKEEPIYINSEDIEVSTNDIEGFEVAVKGNLTVALDLVITPQLKMRALPENSLTGYKI